MIRHQAIPLFCFVFYASSVFAQASENNLPATKKGACYIQYTAPAVIETTTEQILVKPEQTQKNPTTGELEVTVPAIYRTETVQKIVRARQEDLAETICAKDQTYIFIQTLQRALIARGHYKGAITGVVDDKTKRAIRKAQKLIGINSTEITFALAESYGLVTHRLFAQ